MKLWDYGISYKFYGISNDIGLWYKGVTLHTVCEHLASPGCMVSVFNDSAPLFTITSGKQITNLYLSMRDNGVVVHTFPSEPRSLSKGLMDLIPSDYLKMMNWDVNHANIGVGK